MDRPFLQTPEWLAFQKSLGRSIWQFDDGFLKAEIVRHDGRLGQNFLYIPYGPELNLDQSVNGLHNDIRAFADHLRSLARQEHSMFIKIEPMHDMVVELLMRNGLKLRKARRSIQPRSTVLLDLTQTADQLMDNLHHKHRYNISLAERKGVTSELATNVDVFWKLLQSTAEHDDFRTHNQLYYKRLLNTFADPNGAIRTRLYLAHHGGRPIAGVIILEHAHTAYYLHGALDREYRSLMAPHLLHWNLIQQYKQAGYHWYDFWGIDAITYPGVTRFKLGFGAKTIEYPGSFDLVTKPWWYRLYRLLGR